MKNERKENVTITNSRKLNEKDFESVQRRVKNYTLNTRSDEIRSFHKMKS